jgi:hypothetical protein
MIITIGSPIPVEKSPKNQFQLEVRYMSGDADSYENLKFMFLDGSNNKFEEDKFTLQNALKILHAYMKADWNSKCGISCTKLSKLLNIDEKIISDAADNEFFPGDVTCDHQYMAMIDSYKLFYWSKEGIKHSVTVSERLDNTP